MWLVAEGKRVEYAEEVYSINEAQDGKKITLLCPTMQIRSRGDTLNRPTLTVVCQHSMIIKSRRPTIYRSWKP
jgi:alpha-D-xyloside xylohydrolase